MICPPDHAHDGNLTCYVQHKCRCVDCTLGATEYNYHRRHMAAFGRTKMVPARGLARRVQALVALGWSIQVIADRAGVQAPALRRMIRAPHVRRTTHDKIVRAYDAMSSTRPTPVTKWDKSGLTRTLKLAAERRWLPPAAWDDIDTDVTPPVPEPISGYVSEPAIMLAMQGEEIRLTRAERDEFMARRRVVIARMTEEGATVKEIHEVTGWTLKMIERDRAALGGITRPVDQDFSHARVRRTA